MAPDNAVWIEAKRIFGEALDLEPENRAAFLIQACGADSELHREVSSLLENHLGPDSFFERPPAGEMVPRADPMIGKRVGLYKTLRQIGLGGMGAVYLAERADDQFRKRVALKVVRPGLLDEHTLRRFQNERQTLAVLDHPNIIKLLDGGTTEDGAPYLVTEYVEGQAIDKYCESRKLHVRERLELFRTVLAAVHCAHQNLVVHRDLKPSNILVTPEGVPKLLDFGIAKLLRPEYGQHGMGLTRTEMQPMTPEFASPEQIQGNPITTASDIYSLGVILYGLLTGSHPYRLKTHTALELERAICETEPEKPSRFASHAEAAVRSEAGLLRGDLDTIVLMAMRKEPQRRYASVAHFSEDIRRHLEGWPVTARKAGAWYRATKFVGRNKATCAGAALLSVALIASGIATFMENRAAERRFEDLRHFANFVLGDLDDALRQGSTPARQKLASKGLEYLDGLAREKSNPAIRHELVNGYIKNGDAQGNLYGASLGETAGAEASYRKALAIAQQLVRGAPEYKQDVVSAEMKLGQVLTATGNRQEALKHYDEAYRMNESIAPAGSSDETALRAQANLWADMASARSQLSDPEGALESYRRALETSQRLPATYPAKANMIAFTKEQVAYFAALTGDASGAEQAIRESIATYQRGIAANPRPALRRRLAKAYKELADVQNRVGKKAEALATLRLSLGMTEELLAADPKNKQDQLDRQQALMMEAGLLTANNLTQEAKTQTKAALQMMKALADEPNASYQHASDYAELLAITPFAELRDDAAALTYARRAVALTHEKDPNVLHVLALAFERNGDKRSALDADRKALAALPETKAGHAPTEFRKTLEAETARWSQ